MKIKFSKTMSLLLALIMTFALCTTTALAVEKECPIPKASKDGATVSEEVDSTHSEKGDNEIGTTFYMYIPPDPIVDPIPDMGDLGYDLDILVISAIGVGLAYIVVSRYAYSQT